MTYRTFELSFGDMGFVLLSEGMAKEAMDGFIEYMTRKLDEYGINFTYDVKETGIDRKLVLTFLDDCFERQLLIGNDLRDHFNKYEHISRIQFNKLGVTEMEMEMAMIIDVVWHEKI